MNELGEAIQDAAFDETFPRPTRTRGALGGQTFLSDRIADIPNPGRQEYLPSAPSRTARRTFRELKKHPESPPIGITPCRRLKGRKHYPAHPPPTMDATRL